MGFRDIFDYGYGFRSGFEDINDEGFEGNSLGGGVDRLELDDYNG